MALPSAPSGRRRVTILDIAILIAAIACGLALLRTQTYTIAFRQWQLYSVYSAGSPFYIVRPHLHKYFTIVIYVLPFLFSLTVAVVVLALVSRRVERTETLRQPGVSACFLVVLATLLFAGVELARDFAYHAFHERVNWLRWLSFGIATAVNRAGVLVVAMWVYQASVGARRGPSDWIDKLGRVLGLLWGLLLLTPPS